MKAQEEREKQAMRTGAQEERREEARKAKAQEGHKGEEEMTKQEECVEAKTQANSMHDGSHVSNRHMTWWRKAWWIRTDDGASMRSARGRRRVWRAARRAAELARYDDGVEETQGPAEEAHWGEMENEESGETDQNVQ